MKAKTFLELAALSAGLYAIAKETQLLEKLKELSAEGREKFDEFMAENFVDEEGNEIPLTDKLLMKAKEAREELEGKINDMVTTFYEKLNNTHAEKLGDLEERMEQMNQTLAALEARYVKQSENNS